MKQIFIPIIVIILALSLPSMLRAQEAERVYQGFSGGMMLHVGYLSGINENAPVSPKGLTNGIGGAMRVNLWKHLRVGMEGYVSTLGSKHSDARELLADGSYIRTGFGGLLADLCWREGRWWPYFGLGFGGGSMKGLYILEGDQTDWLPEGNVVFNKQSFFYATPYVGTDFCMNSKMHLTFKVDWMMAMHDGALLNPMGPRFYFGFMFCH